MALLGLPLLLCVSVYQGILCEGGGGGEGEEAERGREMEMCKEGRGEMTLRRRLL